MVRCFRLEAIYVGVPKVLNFGGGAIWLARRAGQAGDPSLRLKSGYAQDDADERGERCFFKTDPLFCPSTASLGQSKVVPSPTETSLLTP